MLSSVRQFLLVFVSFPGSFMLVWLHQLGMSNHEASHLEDPGVLFVVNRKSPAQKIQVGSITVKLNISLIFCSPQ
jgi:hypothetical protein